MMTKEKMLGVEDVEDGDVGGKLMKKKWMGKTCTTQ